LGSKTATPVISPPAGSYGYAINISITDATPGATIRYTTDGTDPMTSSIAKVYTAPFLLETSATVKAIASAPNFTNSQLASSVYIIGGTPAVLTMPAISVTASGGTLRALVNGHNLAGQVWFVYGTSSSALTSSTPTQTLNPALNGATFQAPLAALSANTTYYYQPIVTTAGGTSSGAILSFMTP
jgi:hypothetical protein